jgi:hypothetical protein
LKFSSKPDLTLLISPTKEVEMKKSGLVLVLMVAVGQSGCAFLGGAAVGALGTSAGYEINAHSKMDQLDDDYKNERISRKEYETRKAQIEKGSIIY